MKLKALAAAVVLAAAMPVHAETDVLVFGASHHFQTEGRQYNERNWGLGAEWSPEASNWLIGGFVLKDSLSHLGGAAYGGYRWQWPIGSTDVHVELTVRGGLLKDADYFGPAVIPSIGIGWGNTTVEATYLPKIGGNKVPAAVIWLRYRF